MILDQMIGLHGVRPRMGVPVSCLVQDGRAAHHAGQGTTPLFLNGSAVPTGVGVSIHAPKFLYGNFARNDLCAQVTTVEGRAFGISTTPQSMI